MPELPEVETIVRELQGSKLKGVRISDVSIFWERSIQKDSPEAFHQKVVGKKIEDIMRSGKHIVFHLDQGVLYLHLRMTGKLIFISPDESPSKHERVRLLFSDGRCLRYEDQRKFGKWRYLESADVGEKEAAIGLEPLSEKFTLVAFKHLLEHHKQKLKPFLLNQRYIAGLGNIYVDEALWVSCLHPEKLTNTLTNKEMQALHKAIIAVLEKGIKNQGTTLGNLNSNYFSVSGRRGGNQYQLNVFRQEGLTCSRCGSTIVKMTVAQRGTHICPSCQKI